VVSGAGFRHHVSPAAGCHLWERDAGWSHQPQFKVSFTHTGVAALPAQGSEQDRCGVLRESCLSGLGCRERAEESGYDGDSADRQAKLNAGVLPFKPAASAGAVAARRQAGLVRCWHPLPLSCSAKRFSS